MIDSLVGNDYSLFLCNELAKQGVDITLILTEDRIVSVPINFNLLKIMPSKDPSRSKFRKTLVFFIYFLKVMKLVLRNNFKIIHYQFFRHKGIETIFYIFLKILPVKLVHTAHDVILVNEHRVFIILNKIIYKFSDAIIVHSNKNKMHLIKFYRVKENKIFITPHGSFDYYNKTFHDDKETFKSQLGINKNQLTLLFFGFIKEYKGLDLLLDAIKNITTIKLNLIIAGKFESEKIKKDIINRINQLPSNITLIKDFNFIDESKISLYFNIADIVILPYKRISHSGILHLAYSFSKPVLVTNVGDFDEFVENFKSGLIVDANSESIKNAIENILAYNLNLRSMGLYAYELNQSKYTWEISALKLNSVYKILLNNINVKKNN